MLQRKPIICAENSIELNFLNYRNCFIAYVLDIPIKFFTDLNYKQFCEFLDYGYSFYKINKFELTGRF